MPFPNHSLTLILSFFFHRVQNYKFPLVQTTVSEIVDLKDDFKAILLAKTCCYGEAGGQIGDSGKISNMDGQTMFQIKDTQLDHKNGHVWHIGNNIKIFKMLHCNVESLQTCALGKFEEYRNLNVGQRVRVNFDVGKRIKLMQNHTGTHLLNCVLNKMFQFTRQKSR